MVMAPEPLFAAVEAAAPPRPLFLLVAGGPALRPGAWPASWPRARVLAAVRSLRGRRPAGRRPLCDGELSVGDFVLAGGEAAALVVIEAVPGSCPGVMGNDESAATSRSAGGLLEYPQYTRPAEFRGWAVPEVLRSGDHARIARWRRAQALRRTLERRPDLLGGRRSRRRSRRSSTSSGLDRRPG